MHFQGSGEKSQFLMPEQEGLPFLRKGMVGDWKNYCTPELNERFKSEVMAKLEGIGLEF